MVSGGRGFNELVRLCNENESIEERGREGTNNQYIDSEQKNQSNKVVVVDITDK